MLPKVFSLFTKRNNSLPYYITNPFGWKHIQEVKFLSNFDAINRKSTIEKIMNLYAQLYSDGAEFFVDNLSVDWPDAVKMAVKEDSGYMADYVIGQSGRIEQVRLDQVKYFN